MTDGGAEVAFTTDALVLGRTAVGESDVIVTLFTRSHGRVGAVARGARRSKRRFAAGLEMLTVLAATLGRRRRGAELWSLEGTELVEDHRALASDPIMLGHASYALELVRELAPPEAVEPALLDLVVELWRALGAGPSPSLLRAFELTLCAQLGSAVVLDHCAACEAHELGAGAVFDPARGGVVCGACAARSTGLGVRPLDDEARAYLQQLADVPLIDARAVDAAPDVRVRGRDAMLSIVLHLVGHPLATLAYVTQVHGGLRRG
ncbi:MAG: DNA repair protein RecO [Myxococcales bacterium]|nr:DNA repair protein RecO [Myxococcales bacterium]